MKRRRRLLRIPLNAATVLSLVLCVVAAAAWVRSNLARDSVGWALANRVQFWITTCRGGLFAGAHIPAANGDYQVPRVAWEQSAPVSFAEAWGSQDTLPKRVGFALSYLDGGGGTTRQLGCPYWFVVLLTSILPAARLAEWRRRARRLRMHPNLCQHCGYDCRATPDRCPECGTAMVRSVL